MNNIDIVVAGKTTGQSMGEVFGLEIKPDIAMSQIDMDDYDGIVIGSGTGCPKYFWSDESLREIVKSAYTKNKLIAASCNSPVVLARAGILVGKEATAMPRPDIIKELEGGGAIYKDEAVVTTENIITGRDLSGMEEFAQTVAETLLKIREIKWQKDE
ncbi:putative cysteine protease YraA [subsurface metagenome]